MSQNLNLATLNRWNVGAQWAAPTFNDLIELHNGNPSIRMEKGTDPNKSREILLGYPENPDFTGTPVKSGDHIVFKAWMKTSASSIGDQTATAGIRMGIDFSNANGRITGVQSPRGAYWTPAQGYPTDQHLNYVQWGRTWELRIMDFVVPAVYPVDNVFTTEPTGKLEIPDHFTAWMQVWSGDYGNLDEGIGWFEGTELYINPSMDTPLTFICPFDDLIFNSQADLDAHLALVHNPVEPPKPRSGQIIVNNKAMLGYGATLPPSIVRFLWRARESVISKEVHRKLHPLI